MPFIQKPTSTPVAGWAGSGITISGGTISVASTPFRNLAGTTVYAKPALIQVAGPATYTTGGIPVDVSAIFSSILTVMPCRLFGNVNPAGINGSSGVAMFPVENGTDIFASAKFRLLLGRINITATGTNSAPTITTTTNATPTLIGTTGSALTQVAGATGITGVQAPTFTGNAVAQANQEVTNGSALPNAMTYELIVWGIPV